MTMKSIPPLLKPEVGAAFFGAFPTLRPVQVAAIASLCAGRSAVISASTGSGKTEAVVAPLISLYRIEAIRESKTVILYICPTKALINDLARRLTPPLERLGIRLAVRHGDRNQLETKQADHIVITTPESFAILLTTKHPVLKQIRAVVLDEVHLLYNNQRGLMIAILLHRLRKLVGYEPQFAAISATVGDLDGIRSFLFGSDTDADLLPFSGARILDGDVRVTRSLAELRKLVVRLMKSTQRKLLIFANTRRETEEIAGALKRSSALEHLVVTHHSSLSGNAREDIEKWFSSANKGVCVSTSTLEMGIDIGDIDAVVLYGPTESIESLLQRVGRGNRRAMKTNAICISRDENKSIRESAVLSTMLGLAAEGRMPNQAPFDLFGAIAQQCLVILLERQGGYTLVSEFHEQTNYRAGLTRQIVESILSELASNGLVQRHGFKNRYGATDQLWELYEKNLVWGNFPIAGQTVDLMHAGRHIGSISRSNLMRLAPGSVFRFGGSMYRFLRMIENHVRVELASGTGGETPLVFGGTGRTGLETFVSRALWSWIFQVSECLSYMQAAEWERVCKVVDTIRKRVSYDALPYSRVDGGYKYFTFGGATLNRVILSFFETEGEVTDLSLVVPVQIDWSQLPSTCLDLTRAAERSFASSNRQTIFQQFLPLELQKREWMEAWLKDRDAEDCLRKMRTAQLNQVDPSTFEPFLA